MYVLKNDSDSTLKINKLLYFFKQINTENEKSDVNHQYDFYIVYSWAKYVPRLSKKMIKDVEKIKEKYKGKNIYYASINYDFQKEWKYEYNDSLPEVLKNAFNKSKSK